MGKPQLYFSANANQIPWANTPDGLYAERYLMPLLQHGAQEYVQNAHAEIAVICDGEISLPFTVNHWHPQNSYVCSPYSHYISYAQEELRELGHPRLEVLLRLVLRALGKYLRNVGIDQTVYVNNWLLSTNLYPNLPAQNARAMLECLQAHYPTRAIVFRSLDNTSNPHLCQAMRQAGAQLVMSRSIWFQHIQDPAVQKRRDFKNDLRLLKNSPYRLLRAEELQESDIPRLLELYAMLYLDKYSFFNPQFTPQFLKHALQERLLFVSAFAKDGKIDAVKGFFVRNGYATAPLFGYDTSLPRDAGLYRLLSVQMSLDILELGAVAHFSAGVGSFKRQRGAVQAIEYNAVYTRHLPTQLRQAWALLALIVGKIAEPVMLRTGL